MQDFRRLDVWQRSYRLALAVYQITKAFPKDELYGLVSQMRRASTSVPSNIAEGCGRNTGTDMARFLDIALGSLSEIDCYLDFARDLSYMSREDYLKLEKELVEVRRMLIGFIKSVRHAART